MAATPKPVRKLMKKSSKLDVKSRDEAQKKRNISNVLTKEFKKKDKANLKSSKSEFKKHFGESKEKTAKNLKKISI